MHPILIYRAIVGFVLLGLFGCESKAIQEQKTTPHLPSHSECFSEPMEDEVCYDVIAEHNQQPTESYNQSGLPSSEDDERITDPDYLWLGEEARRCDCACCHNSRLSGSGTFFWDVAFEPVWIDSANAWSLSVLVGETDEPDQTLPTSDPERLRELIERERVRRGF